MFNDLAFVVMLSSTNSPVRKQSIFQPLGLIECKSLVLSEGGRKVINFFLQIRKESKNDKIDYEFLTCFLSLGYLLNIFVKKGTNFQMLVSVQPSLLQGGQGDFSPSVPTGVSHGAAVVKLHATCCNGLINPQVDGWICPVLSCPLLATLKSIADALV